MLLTLNLFHGYNRTLLTSCESERLRWLTTSTWCVSKA